MGSDTLWKCQRNIQFDIKKNDKAIFEKFKKAQSMASYSDYRSAERRGLSVKWSIICELFCGRLTEKSDWIRYENDTVILAVNQ